MRHWRCGSGIKVDDLPQHAGSDDDRDPTHVSRSHLGTSYGLVRRISVFPCPNEDSLETKNRFSAAWRDWYSLARSDSFSQTPGLIELI